MGDIKALQKGLSKLPQVLGMFGYSSLRPGQDKVVYSILSKQDVIAILPTGAGKTSCFVIPALCHGWPTLVFSPLQALMRDQCMNLWKADVPAGRLSGDQSEGENMESIRAWTSGRLNILFVAPERMQNKHFQEAMRTRPPKLISVDEVHAISEWSDNFRPDYAKIGDFLNNLNERVEVVAAFSATLPPVAEADVRRVLKIPKAIRIKHYPRRENLILSSSPRTSEWELMKLMGPIDGSIIIYCATRKNVNDMATWLSSRPEYMDKVAPYHAGLPKDLRRQYQDDFMSGEKQVIVATNAFGMGVDKSDIRGIIHWDSPGSVEAYAQEAGRGGRDGKDTICHVFTSQEAERTQEFLLEKSNPSPEEVRQVYNLIKYMCGSLGGVAHTSNKEMAYKAGIHESRISACFSYLVSSGVVDRYKSSELTAYARFPNPDNPEENERFLKGCDVSGLFEVYSQTVDRLGVKVDKGLTKFDLQLLADQLSVQDNTVRSNLSKWARMDLVTYEPPFSGIVTKLVGTEDQVDWQRIRKKREENIQKLMDMQKYLQQDDDKKHEFLEQYFAGQTG